MNMRKTLFVAILSLICTVQTFGQLTDQNTELINSYFQVNTVQSSISSTQQTDAKVSADVIQKGSENEVYINSLQQGDSQVVIQRVTKTILNFTTTIVINRQIW